jgi:hypothetical protein
MTLKELNNFGAQNALKMKGFFEAQLDEKIN